MKILVFSGGLGNQIFGCAFYKYLQQKSYGHNVYGIYSSLWLNEHNGFEVDKIFDVDLPKTSWVAKMVAFVFFILKKIHLFRSKVSMDTRTFNSKLIVLSACKMNIEYLPKGEWINFKKITLDTQNLKVYTQIQKTNSVFIHVRKGDYLSSKYIKRMGGTCPIDYYNQAIEKISLFQDDLHFFVFSDDMEWVKNNLFIPNPIYVDWNRGKKSFIDMYLMSNCKYAIIANSTFSYWGAMLGRKKKFVTYPSHWVNPPAEIPPIFPDNWIKL